MIEERGLVQGHDGAFALVETEKKSLCGGCVTTLLCNTMTGDKPVLIRIETRAGHGAGKPTSKRIEEVVDIFSFAQYHTQPAE